MHGQSGAKLKSHNEHLLIITFIITFSARQLLMGTACRVSCDSQLYFHVKEQRKE